jgi:hypothetical protein
MAYWSIVKEVSKEVVHEKPLHSTRLSGRAKTVRRNKAGPLAGHAPTGSIHAAVRSSPGIANMPEHYSSGAHDINMITPCLCLGIVNGVFVSSRYGRE